MKAILISIKEKKEKKFKNSAYEIEELKRLCQTAYLTPVVTLDLYTDKTNPSLLLGYGKAEEIKEIIKENKIRIAVFNQNLNATQQRNLEELWEIDVIDRTFLILKIFQQRARTAEGKIQVEMARLKYGLSRISGFGEYMDQQDGMVGTRGAGEKKIEYTKRALKDKISLLKKELEKIEIQREVQRYKRLSIPMPQVSIVGYTNAGKSTLLDALTENKHNIYADDKLFATLDPLTKKVKLGSGSYILVSDTVGFINNLPHSLIAAFRSTLKEIQFSDLIIHLHDITSPYLKKQSEVVFKTLKEINADHIPVINVFNKIDAIENLSLIKPQLEEFSPIFISAKERKGFDILFKEIETKLSYKWKQQKILIPYDKASLVSKIRNISLIKNENFNAEGILMELYITDENFEKIKKLIYSS